jgi:hypothetical protein
VALPENSLAHDAIAMSSDLVLLEQLKPEELEMLIAEKEAAKDTKATSKLPEKYQHIPLEVLKAFQAGDAPTNDALEYLLSLLPIVN